MKSWKIIILIWGHFSFVKVWFFTENTDHFVKVEVTCSWLRFTLCGSDVYEANIKQFGCDLGVRAVYWCIIRPTLCFQARFRTSAEVRPPSVLSIECVFLGRPWWRLTGNHWISWSGPSLFLSLCFPFFPRDILSSIFVDPFSLNPPKLHN